MPHYVAIVEDAGPDKAIGLWFPDLPGCFSAGDTVDEALVNAEEALSLYAESLARDGRSLPPTAFGVDLAQRSRDCLGHARPCGSADRLSWQDRTRRRITK
jgi:predicted RNase H-like HicB family nuclease